MVRKELDGYSDLDLHQLCVEHQGSLAAIELPEEVLFESTKVAYLRNKVRAQQQQQQQPSPSSPATQPPRCKQ